MPAARGQGQWGLGYREPLNANEQVKKDSDPLTVKQRIIDTYSKQGFDSIDGARPARPDALVRAVHPARRRHPRRQDRRAGAARARGAVLHAAHPRRQRPADLRAAAHHRRDQHRRTAATSPTSPTGRTSSCTGSASRTSRRSGSGWTRSAWTPPRPAATARASSSAARSPAWRTTRSSTRPACCRQVRDRYIGDPAFSNLPRKFKTSISGCSVHCTNHEINDVAFVGVELPDGRKGYDLWVGGGLSTNPKLGLRLGAFVEPERVAEVWAGVTSVFRDYGYRRSRMHARLKFLLADWGTEKFRQVLENEYLTAPLPDGPAPATPPTAGARPRRRAPPVRRPQLRRRRPARRPHQRPAAAARRRARRAATARAASRPPPSRAWSSSTCRTSTSTRSSTSSSPTTCGCDPSRFRRGVLACTGLEFCKLAIVETKARVGRPLRRAREAAAGLRRAADHQRQRLPQLLRPVPDRRHRPQGLDRRRRGGLPGPPRRAARRGRRLRPQVARAQGHRRRRGRLRRAGAAQLPRAPRAGREVRRLGAAGRRGAPEVTARARAVPVLLPVLRRGVAAPVGRRPRQGPRHVALRGLRPGLRPALHRHRAAARRRVTDRPAHRAARPARSGCRRTARRTRR